MVAIEVERLAIGKPHRMRAAVARDLITGARRSILDSVKYRIQTGGTDGFWVELEGGLHVAASPLAQDVDAVRRFNRFYTRQIGVLQEKLLLSPFSLTEGRVLYEIGYHGDTGIPRATAPTAVGLARALGIDGGYLSRILQRFARRRLITRTTSNADARQVHLALTERGRVALAPLQQLARDEVAVMLRQLSPMERGRVVDAMHLIQTSLAKPGNDTVTATAANERGA